jgi:hypothetical protein
MGEDALPILSVEMSGETRHHDAPALNSVVARLGRNSPSPNRLRGLRALQVLEDVGTPEARKVLESLADGAAGAPLTRDAKAALERLRTVRPGRASAR